MADMPSNPTKVNSRHGSNGNEDVYSTLFKTEASLSDVLQCYNQDIHFKESFLPLYREYTQRILSSTDGASVY